MNADTTGQTPNYDAAAIARELAALKAQVQSPIVQGLIAFFTEILLGQPAHFKAKLPTVKETQQATFLGKTWTFTEELDGETAKISATPS